MPIDGANASKQQMRRVRVSPDNEYVVVSSNQDHHAAIYEADGLKQIASFPTKKSPMGFGFAPDGTHAYICCHDDAEVFEFELATGRVTRTFPTAAGCELSSLIIDIPERLAEKPRALEPVAPGLLDRLGDADARPGDDLDSRRRAHELERRRVEREPVVRVGDAERLVSRPGPEHNSRSSARPRRRRIAARPSVGSSARISTALAEPFALADEIDAPVDAVGAIDIGIARRAEHHGVALGLSADS